MNLNFKLLLLFVPLLLFTNKSWSVEPKDHVVFTKIQFDTVGQLKAIFKWNLDTNAYYYAIKRKLPDDSGWDLPIAELSGRDSTYVDSTILSGIGYEYSILKRASFPTDSIPYSYEGFAYLYAGYKLSVPDYRGKLLLLIDSSISDSLKLEINRLIIDLTAEGWNVIRKDVSRTENFDINDIKRNKNLIVEEYNKSNGELKSLILLGRLAVPYSGDFAVDEHIEHQGAWVADSYYSDIDGEWTDEKVNDTIAVRNENDNVPGDGKFDQNQIPSNIELQTGRIDFYNLNYYGKSEISLLRNYLNKNHDYRTGIIKPSFSGIIDDNFGMYGEVFASNGWMEFSGLVGPENVKKGEFMISRDTPARLFAYGCGSGSYRNVLSAAHLAELDTTNSGGIFSFLLGSYNGDWDVENNILRSVLAYSPYALTCSWAGRPYWHIFQMGLGETIGYSAKITQNNQDTYLSNGRYGYRFTHVSLLGDPTLRMFFEEPAFNFNLSSEVSFTQSKVYLNWESGGQRLLGFNIYRSDDILNKFQKLNDTMIIENEFIDENPQTGKNIYMVRAVRDRDTETGTIINLSHGVFVETDIPVLSYSSKISYSLKCHPNPAESWTDISFVVSQKEDINFSIWDLEGKLVTILTNSILNPGHYLHHWDLRNDNGEIVQSGVYLIKFTSKNKSIVAKLNVIR